MTLHASSWAHYDLDASWIDETTHVLRRAGAGEAAESLIVHRDPESPGLTGAQYAERQHALLAASLPGFTLQRSVPYRLDARDAHELAFHWTTPNGPIEQVQVHVPGPDGMILFTATGAPRLSPQGRASFIQMLASVRIPGNP